MIISEKDNLGLACLLPHHAIFARARDSCRIRVTY